jgi:hypothetical protein
VSQREVTNIPASVRARLLSQAKERGESFDQILVYFAIERFLHRLSHTEWGDRFVVKGATMLRAWGTPLGRPTRDIDFSGAIGNSPSAVAAAISECLEIEYLADGLAFNGEIKTRRINVADRYPGVSATVTGHLDGARFKLKVDVGIDDVVVPDPEWVDYPTLLDLEAPRVLAYLPSTAIAEKFETMVSLGITNSRMKDFYDVWLLSTAHEFDGAELVSALGATFTHRCTEVPSGSPVALTAGFWNDPTAVARWKAFRSTSGIKAPAELREVCEAIVTFLMPPAAATATSDVFSRIWVPVRGWL